MASVDCKVVILGSASVGKTCLLERYIHERFQENTQATIAGSFAAKKETVGTNEVVLGCWDTAGSERYASLSRMYYRSARAAIVCFDATHRPSYEAARHWVSELKTTEEDCKIYVCGTKKDHIDANPHLRTVTKLEVKELATDLQADYFETSSKTGQNIDTLFKKIARDFVISENAICNGHSTRESESIKVSWRKDHRIVQDKSSCCHR